jgi:hypothetical protein
MYEGYSSRSYDANALPNLWEADSAPGRQLLFSPNTSGKCRVSDAGSNGKNWIFDYKHL